MVRLPMATSNRNSSFEGVENTKKNHLLVLPLTPTHVCTHKHVVKHTHTHPLSLTHTHTLTHTSSLSNSVILTRKLSVSVFGSVIYILNRSLSDCVSVYVCVCMCLHVCKCAIFSLKLKHKPTNKPNIELIIQFKPVRFLSTLCVKSTTSCVCLFLSLANFHTFSHTHTHAHPHTSTFDTLP